MSGSDDWRQALDGRWAEKWHMTSPVADELRAIHADVWVRFHSLPDAKRLAETDAEYATLLSRHHAILDALGLRDTCLVIAPRYAEQPLEPAVHEWHWRTVRSDTFLEPVDLHAFTVDYPSPGLDAVLREVADDRLGGVILAPLDVEWLYHPYDGGADVLAASPAERDRLKETFADWLSSRTDGL